MVEENLTQQVPNEDEDEHVLLDLDAVSGIVDISPNTPYVLTGLDTLNPILILDGKIKLIGEYEETIGTCFVFSENAVPVVHEESGPSEANLFSGKRIIDTNQPPGKEVKLVARLHKILKFRLLADSDDDEHHGDDDGDHGDDIEEVKDDQDS